MTLVRLMVRRHRLLLGAWAALLVTLPAVTVTAYRSTYGTAEQRRAAVEAAQQDPAMTLMYGQLPDPGTPAQMFVWEIGAFATVLVALMAVLVGVALTRAMEDDGTLELLRSCGLDPAAPLRAALAVLAGVAGVLAIGFCLVSGLAGGNVDGVTWSGSAAFGAVVGSTFLLTGTLTVVLAQVAPTAPGARTLAFAAVGVAFALRAFADTQDLDTLGWLSPLGLRAAVQPFGAERWWVIVAHLAVALGLGVSAEALSRRREYRAGLLHSPDARRKRLGARNGLGLVARLSRRSVLAWAVGVAGIGTLFSSMGAPAVEQGRQGNLDGFLGSQLGTADPVAGYFSYSGTVIGIAVCTFAVLSVQRARHDEVAGQTEQILTTGTPRWAPLAWQMVITATGSLVILLLIGGLSAMILPLTLEGEHVAVRAFAYVVGQWPSVLALAGLTALIFGLLPRATWLAWLPLAASAALAMLGGLLGVPKGVRDLGVFGHVPDIATGDLGSGGLLTMTALASAATAVGVMAIVHRDVDL